MSWIYLALLAPFLTAIVNLFDDNLLQNVYKDAHAAVIVSSLFGIVPLLAIPAFGLNHDSVSAHLIVLNIISGFLAMIAIYYYFRGLELEDPSVVAALFSLTPAVIPFLAHYIVGERLSVRACVGFAIVLVSAFLYSLSDIKKFRLSKALLPVLLASALFDASSLASKYSYERVNFYSAYFYVALGMTLAGVFYLGAWHRFKSRISLRSVRKAISVKLVLLLVLVEVLGLAAEFAFNKALSQGPLSLVNALENTQPLFVLLIAVVLYPLYPQYFREAESGRVKIKVLLSLLLVGGIYVAVG